MTTNGAMINAAVAALACLCLARGSPTEPHSLRAYSHAHNKELGTILAGIEERLRLLDNISMAQVKQARRLDVIQDKLDRVETTLSLRLERAQLAADRLEHRLHMLQTSVQTSIKEGSNRLERSQMKITEIAINLTNHIEGHRLLLEKVNGAYADTWRRGLVLENMMRDGLALVNVTRRELADGLRGLARRHRDTRFNSVDIEAIIMRKLNENSLKIDKKMQEALDTQKRFVDSCQRIQLDDPNHVADVLDRLIDSLINKTASTFKELQNIQMTIRSHDNKVMKLLSSTRSTQNDGSCRRLENVFKNISTQSVFKETELKQLTEKFVELTDRADAALQRLEGRLNDDDDAQASDVASAADRLMIKLTGIKNEQESADDLEWDGDNPYFEGREMVENVALQRGKRHGHPAPGEARSPRTRHLHKHPYDRGPKKKPTQSEDPA